MSVTCNAFTGEIKGGTLAELYQWRENIERIMANRRGESPEPKLDLYPLLKNEECSS